MTDASNDSSRDREAIWRLHCLAEPTFSDVTQGVFLGLLWSVALWTPMFIAVLL